LGLNPASRASKPSIFKKERARAGEHKKVNYSRTKQKARGEEVQFRRKIQGKEGEKMKRKNENPRRTFQGSEVLHPLKHNTSNKETSLLTKPFGEPI